MEEKKKNTIILSTEKVGRKLNIKDDGAEAITSLFRRSPSTETVEVGKKWWGSKVTV